MKNHYPSLILIWIFLLGSSVFVYGLTAINGCSDLASISTNDINADYYLNASISCPNFTPIGAYSGNPFRGTLDGRGYSLSITMESSSPHTGLFKYCLNANIVNITISDSSLFLISGNFQNHGFLCAYADTTTFSYIRVYNSVMNTSESGTFASMGLVAGYCGVNSQLDHITIENSQILCNTANCESTGGIAGSIFISNFF